MTQANLFVEILAAQEKGHAFVLYRRPKTTVVKAYICANVSARIGVDPGFSGFVMAPFDTQQPSLYFSRNDSRLLAATQDLGLPLTHGVEKLSTEAKAAYCERVVQAKEFLKGEGSEKVVLSRQLLREVKSFNLEAAFASLLVHASAFVYACFHPDAGLWVGATPETLVQVDGAQFSTMALAGTAKLPLSGSPAWGAKEVHEQAVVTHYIKAQLQAVALHVSEPYTIKAGNIAHIRTDISGALGAELDLEQLINQLHPTPAVCGIPVEKTRNYILDEEPLSREFYTGYLGELNCEGKSNLFVNLRCMRIRQNQAHIFVGGGITAGSIPIHEWQETSHKAALMLGVLDLYS